MLQQKSSMPDVFGTSLQLLREYVTSRGVGATSRQLLSMCVYSRRSYVLVCKATDVDVPHISARIPGTIRLAVADDVERLRVFAHRYTGAQFRRWIEQRRGLYVFEHQGRLIAYRLVSRDVPRLSVARKIIRLEPTDTWVVSSYTLPDFRGARIGAALACHSLAENRVAGFKREISLIRADNEAARKMVGLAGGREVEEVTCTRLLGFKRYRRRVLQPCRH
ncbi:MAG TPA: GNAT family N-acetyltransferase [Candidatus Acidoferrales bacterium]|nr:GNAT family N-acetyltransferase [Candidatus Acidoferrales bacterium]